MGTGYTRNDVSNNIADGNIINASDLDGEFDAVESAFNSSTGHTHDGTAAEGGAITVVGPVQDLVVSATEVKPKTTNTLDLGTSGLLYKDAYLQGNMYFRDTALKIVSSADGQLDIDADVELELVAPTVDIDASTAVTVDTASTTFTSTVFNVTGSANITGDLDVDNINIDGNTIISTDTNGAINITPNGTGAVNITATTNITGDLDVDNININGNTIISTDTNGDINISPDGTGTVVIDTDLDVDNINVNGNTVSSTNTNGDINLSPNGTGTVVINTDLDVDNINVNGNTVSSTDTNGDINLSPNGTGTVVINTDLDVDNININGNTISSTDTNGNINLVPNGTGEVNLTDNDKLTFGASSDLQIYHDGSNSYIEDTGTGNLRMKGATKVQLIADNNEDMLHAIAGGAVEIYYDNAKKFETTSTGVDVTGTVTADGLTVDGDAEVVTSTTATDMSDPMLRVSGSSYTAGGVYGMGFHYTDDATDVTPTFIGYKLNSGSGNTNGHLVFGTRELTTQGSVPLERMRIGHNGDISFYDTSGNASFVYDESAGSTFNEQGADRDFRVESDTDTHALFVDAGNSRVGINNSSPDAALHVLTQGTSGEDGVLKIGGSAASLGLALEYDQSGSTTSTITANPTYTSAGQRLILRADGDLNTEQFVLYGDGHIVVNEDSRDADFRVESDANSNAFLLDGATGFIGIGHAAPDRPIHIKGAGSSGQILLEGTGSGYTEGSVICLNSSTNNPQTRGNGIYMADSSDNVEWFAGRPYGSNDNFIISRNGSYTSYGQESAQTSYAYVTVNYNGNVIINENSNDVDFRVESNNEASMLFVDGGNDRVGIKTGSPRTVLDLGTTRELKMRWGTAGSLGELQNVAGEYISNNVYPSSESAGTITYTKTTGDAGNVILQDYVDGIRFFTGVTGSGGSTGTLNTFQRAKIDTSGNFMVGGTSALSSSKITTYSSGNCHLATRNTSATAGYLWRYEVDSTNAVYIINHNSAGVYISNGATSWSALSDETSKNIIEPITNAVEKVSSLRTVIGSYKSDAAQNRRPFLIAQDVQAVLPEAVTVANQETGELGLSYSDTIPLLVAAIKEQQETITALEARIAALEAN